MKQQTILQKIYISTEITTTTKTNPPTPQATPIITLKLVVCSTTAGAEVSDTIFIQVVLYLMTPRELTFELENPKMPINGSYCVKVHV